MNMQVLDAQRDVSGGWKVDAKRGERIGRVSSERFPARCATFKKALDLPMLVSCRVMLFVLTIGDKYVRSPSPQ